INIESTITFNGILSITSPQNTLVVGSPSGPNTTLDVRDGAITTAKLADGAVTNAKIQNGAVTTTKIVDFAITLQKLAPGLIPTTLPPSGPASGDLTGSYPGPLIANGAVTTSKLADNSITTPKLTDGVVTTPKLADNSVTSDKLTPTGVTAGTFGNTTNIPQVTVDDKGRVTGIVNIPLVNFPWIVPAGGDLTGTYPNPLIAPNAVTTNKILDLNVTTAKLADGAVTNSKLGANSITGDKVADGTLTVNDLAPGTIPTTLPPSGPAGGELTGTYPNPLIQNGVITTAKIADGAVSNTKLGSNSVTTDKIVDGTVQAIDLAPGLIPTVFPPSGAAGGELTGNYPNPLIQNGVITTAKLADGSVTNPKLGANAVTTDKILDGTVGLVDLAPGIIPTVFPPSGPAGGELTGSYPNPQIQNGVITTAKIADGAVTGTKLADNTVTTNKIVDGTIGLVDLQPGLIPTTLPPSGPAGGALAGAYPNPSIATSAGDQLLTAINNGATTGKLADNRLNTTGVTAGTYGDGAAGFVPRVTIDIYGRVTAASSQQILSAQPSGAAGGDLTGTYPAPLLNVTAGAGSRMVDAIRTDYIAGDADINTPNNLVVLDATNRLPAVNGSLLLNLNASAISSGILGIAYGGTNSNTSLVNNRMMWSNGGKIVEAPQLTAGQIFIGTGPSSAPANGSVVAGPGVSVVYSNPNLVISSLDARLAPGNANDQTVRWDSGLNSWVPNANVLATAAGNVTTNGNLVVNGTTELKGNSDIGVNPGTSNWFGKGAGSVNSVGSTTSTNWVYGTTNINTNVDANTNIGMMSGNTSSIVLAAGTNGNITMENIDTEVPFAFMSLNPQRQVRTALASGLALEGIQWQNGAFRLGGENPLTNPLLSTRYINLNNQQLNFTGVNGTRTLINLNGAFPTVNVTATTNINTTGADLTTIGSPTSKTIIGGELDPRGVIRNQMGAVVVLDEFEQYGQAQINFGTEANTYIGNPTGAGQQQNVEIAVGGGVGPNGNLKLINIKNDPLITNVLWLDPMNNVRYQNLVDMADEGVQFHNNRFRLGASESDITPNRTNSYDENRYVNLDDFSVFWTDGSEGVDGVTFLEFDGDFAGAPRITATSLTEINRAGLANTNIGNNGNTTQILSSTINIGTDAFATAVNIGSTLNATNTILGNTYVNAVNNARTQLGNGNGGAAAGRVGIGLDPTTPTYNSTHVIAPYASDVILDVNGVAGQPNVRIGSLSANHPTPYQATVDGLVIADNNGVLRRGAFDVEQGLTFADEGGQTALRLGSTLAGNGAGTNPFEVNRTLNLDQFSLTFNRGAAADPMIVVNGATDDVTVNAATVGVTGTTSINTTGAATTTVGSTATGGNVTINSGNDNDIIIEANGANSDVYINDLPVAVGTENVLMIEQPSNRVMRYPGAPGIAIVRKTADESVVNSAVLQDDDQLSLNLQPNAAYEFEAVVVFSGNNAPFSNLRGAFIGPEFAVTDFSYTATMSGSPLAPSYGEGDDFSLTPLPVDGASPSAKVTVIFKGIILTDGVGGPLRFRWAQDIAGGATSTVHRNSYLKTTRIN
ncbi:MAG TPA: hypothetical protein VK147_01075, partial [Candidatus Didemnitutus sp.]|nr:hypothetical protein [Candidatus Didemnitutus sp.]